MAGNGGPVEQHAVAGPLRGPAGAVLDLDRFGQEAQFGQAAAHHIFEHETVLDAAQQMQRQFHHEMRSHLASERLRQMGDLVPFGDAADKSHIGLHEIHRIGLQIGQNLLAAIEALTQGERRGDGALEEAAVVEPAVAEPATVEPTVAPAPVAGSADDAAPPAETLGAPQEERAKAAPGGGCCYA